MSECQWDSPQEWLANKIEDLTDENNILELHKICQHLFNLVDSDQIQELFQQEMDEDGYFKKIKE